MRTVLLGNLSEDQLFHRCAGRPDLLIVVFSAIADFYEELLDIQRRPVRVPRKRQDFPPEAADRRVAALIVQEPRVVRESERIDAPQDFAPASVRQIPEQRTRTRRGCGLGRRGVCGRGHRYHSKAREQPRPARYI
jgi:hypothetical protein